MTSYNIASNEICSIPSFRSIGTTVIVELLNSIMSSRRRTGISIATAISTKVLNPRRCIMRVHGKYACGTETHAVQIRETANTRATSVGSVFGNPGPRTRPSCYFYCLHRARNGQNLVEVSHAY